MLKLFITILTVCSISAENDYPKIIGGSSAKMGEYPYVVSIQHKDRKRTNICAAAILNKWWVVSAAHCVANLHTDTTVVFLGSVMLQRYGWHYEVQKIRIHPQWDNATGVNDISMIKLKKKLKWRRTVNRVHLPFNITVYLGSWAVVTGWGSTSYPNEANPNHLQIFISRIRDHKNCSSYWGNHTIVDEKMLCFDGEVGHGTCQGDSGAPLVYNKHNKSFLVGIASHWKPCGVGVPDIFTRVKPHIDFIRRYLLGVNP